MTNIRKHYLEIEAICRAALTYSDNDPNVRKKIAAFRNSLRTDTRIRTGTDSSEVIALTALLTVTDPNSKTIKQVESIDIVVALVKMERITETQAKAANEIRKVYSLIVGTNRAAKIDGPRGGRGVPGARLEQLQGTEEFIWRNRWVPWSTHLRRQVYGTGRYKISNYQIVIDVLMNDIRPDVLDKIYKLTVGGAIAIVVSALDSYCELIEENPL